MLTLENAIWILIAALIVDAMLGDPDWLWRRLPHPVVWIGKVISVLERRLNSSKISGTMLKRRGTATLIVLLIGSLGAGSLLQYAALSIPYGEGLIVLIAAVFFAQNSLYTHVAAVRNGLQEDGLAGGRKAVSMIVGRDPEQLDEAGISRAAIESCAENFSDGVVAPVFWFAVLGLPGLIAYKTVNTADSMIGHKNERYLNFGWASARFDDLVNLSASRLSGVFFALSAPIVGGSVSSSLRTIAKDAGKHRSPNAGWPEAAVAGALNLALAGPRIYPGYTVEDPFMNENGRKDANAQDIGRALKLLTGACAIQLVVLCVLAFLETTI